MCMYLRAKFEVSSIILTSFRQGVSLHSPHPPPQNEPIISPLRLGLSLMKNNYILDSLRRGCKQKIEM